MFRIALIALPILLIISIIKIKDVFGSEKPENPEKASKTLEKAGGEPLAKLPAARPSSASQPAAVAEGTSADISGFARLEGSPVVFREGEAFSLGSVLYWMEGSPVLLEVVEATPLILIVQDPGKAARPVPVRLPRPQASSFDLPAQPGSILNPAVAVGGAAQPAGVGDAPPASAQAVLPF